MKFLESIVETLESITFCKILVWCEDSKKVTSHYAEHVYFSKSFYVQNFKC